MGETATRISVRSWEPPPRCTLTPLSSRATTRDPRIRSASSCRSKTARDGTSLAYEVEVDRRRAIARAFEIAEAGDSVLIAGKGHEDYQIFADRTIHFDDREVAREELAARC